MKFSDPLLRLRASLRRQPELSRTDSQPKITLKACFRLSQVPRPGEAVDHRRFHVPRCKEAREGLYAKHFENSPASSSVRRYSAFWLSSTAASIASTATTMARLRNSLLPLRGSKSPPSTGKGGRDDEGGDSLHRCGLSRGVQGPARSKRPSLRDEPAAFRTARRRLLWLNPGASYTGSSRGSNRQRAGRCEVARDYRLGGSRLKCAIASRTIRSSPNRPDIS